MEWIITTCKLDDQPQNFDHQNVLELYIIVLACSRLSEGRMIRIACLDKTLLSWNKARSKGDLGVG